LGKINRNHQNEAESSCCDQRIYVENSKVEESFLLMKFYSLSSVVVSHLLSDRNSNELEEKGLSKLKK